MAEETRVILHGRRLSPYVKRVEIALKIKGTPYEFVEEDLKNKCPLLLKYNPVHKKIPVLVHNGKPLVESFAIRDYIDETWKTGPELLPEDPYKRAQIRFWASFLHQHFFEAWILMSKTKREAQEKAIKELYKKLKLLEDGMKDLFRDGIPSSVDNKIKVPINELPVAKELHIPHEIVVTSVKLLRELALKSSVDT
ncbi:hypothetical protein M0R45_023254 [Rubus argutus]|uniref:Glutathione S-transferase n=1 Tax=Rubus argutus TaxID=59490 RepID=A0AAW1WP90_RUBAR